VESFYDPYQDDKSEASSQGFFYNETDSAYHLEESAGGGGAMDDAYDYTPDLYVSPRAKARRVASKKGKGALLKVPEPLFADRPHAGARAGGDHSRGPSRPSAASTASPKQRKRKTKKTSPRNRARPLNPATQSISSALASRFDSFYE
jgi:hypothetical protein